MKQGMGWVLVSGLLLVAVAVFMSPTDEPQVTVVIPVAAVDEIVVPVETPLAADELPEKIVLDVSVHTIEGLRVLFDRAEALAMTPRPEGEDASLVLILHGPEVEYFSIKNYDQYKDIVDQAARLDAFDIVDVRICQTMIGVRGIERTDIPSFIEQVPYGPGEVERLKQDGYVVF
jgi:intracellular sulfur oxidation DsrE/DsrF family protein